MSKPKSDEEAYELSTDEEKMWVDQYRYLQRKGQEQGYMTEGQLLEASQAIAHVVARNKRLGLC